MIGKIIYPVEYGLIFSGVSTRLSFFFSVTTKSRLKLFHPNFSDWSPPGLVSLPIYEADWTASTIRRWTFFCGGSSPNYVRSFLCPVITTDILLRRVLTKLRTKFPLPCDNHIFINPTVRHFPHILLILIFRCPIIVSLNLDRNT
jgi:hypothetical protein